MTDSQECPVEVSNISASKSSSVQSRIIPIAGAKGGVGKTLFSANLAIALSKLGATVIVVDLDLGGSNLHTFLGLGNNNAGIGDYLAKKMQSLDELLVDTSNDNLKFLPGDGVTPFMANIGYAQKQRLLRAIRKLSADYVLLDIGAGSSFNTLDYYSLGAKGLVVTVPESPAIMNMLTFLKNHVFRLINKEISTHQRLKQIVDTAVKAGNPTNPVIVNEVIERISEVDSTVGARLLEVCSEINARLIINMGQDAAEMKELKLLPANIEERLSVRVDFFGFIHYDEGVRASLNCHKSLLEHDPNCIASKSIEVIANRMTRLWDHDLDDSYEKLYQNLLHPTAFRKSA